MNADLADADGDTPIGQQIAWLVGLLEGNDLDVEDVRLHFADSYFARESPEQVTERLRLLLSEFSVAKRSLVESTRHTARLLFTSMGVGSWHMDLEVDERSGLITSMRGAPVDEPGSA